jgi:hypothetical protein
MLQWGPGNDAETSATGLTYNLRVGTTPGGSEIVSPHSSSAGYRRLVALGNAGESRMYHLRGLTPGTTYYWAVQSVDSGFVGSSFAVGGNFTAAADAPQNVAFTREVSGFRTVWKGTPGSAYHVEISEDLSNWLAVAMPTAASGTGLFEFLDSPPANATSRFYRASRP